MYIALIILVYIAAVIILLKPFSWELPKKKSRKHTNINPYLATSLACDAKYCQQTAVMEGRRFLLSEVPELPPIKCTEGNCACYYVHHEDRRDNTDRRVVSRRHVEEGSLDRRSLRGRRKSDWSLLAVTA